MRIIGSSELPATANFNKNDCLLHSTAKPRLIPCCTQTYPQIESELKIDEHRAIVFATIPRVEKRNLVGKVGTLSESVLLFIALYR